MSHNYHEVHEEFKKSLRAIPFVRDELLRKNPRFTLEWNLEEGRYKYIVVDTMFKLFEPMYLKLCDLKSTDNHTEVLQQETPQICDNDEAIILALGGMQNLISNGQLGKVIRVFALQEVYYDRWSAPENLGKMYFYSEEDARNYLKSYADKYHSLRFTPDEYRIMKTLGYEDKYVKELKVAGSDINFNVNAMVDKVI